MSRSCREVRPEFMLWSEKKKVEPSISAPDERQRAKGCPSERGPTQESFRNVSPKIPVHDIASPPSAHCICQRSSESRSKS